MYSTHIKFLRLQCTTVYSVWVYEIYCYKNIATSILLRVYCYEYIATSIVYEYIANTVLGRYCIIQSKDE